MRYYLDFEKQLEPVERRIEEIKKFHDMSDPHYAKELVALEKRLPKLERDIYGNMTNWQRSQLSRHLNRPHTLDFIHHLCTDFVELHGDRKFMDDPAIVGGPARFDNLNVIVVGHQKGKDVRGMADRNFGMANPEGYRKAMRLMELAQRWKKPLITFIDTPGAFPGVGAEERGQAETIASSIYLMFTLLIPVVAIIIGEGGSGGALAIAVGDRILMLENATYSVISPEGCAAILWKDASKGPLSAEARALAADALKPTAQELIKLKVIDAIVKEPFGGAHRSWEVTFENTRALLTRHLKELLEIPAEALREKRYDKFRRMGVFEER
ncbi:MAG: acetyl-CoA carboxylase carboxyltransferase subunit alpha [Syntrophorhabdales bacterium]